MADDSTTLPNAFEPVSFETWAKKLEADLKGKTPASLETELVGGLRLRPLYTADTTRADESWPGLPPYTRGTTPLGNTGGGWRVCQEYDDPRMESAAAKIEADLAAGAQDVWLRIGCDAGIRVLTAGDVEAVLRGVDLAKSRVHLEPLSDALMLAAAYFAVAEKRGIEGAALSGTLGADPLATLAQTGTLPDGYEASVRKMVSLGRHCVESAPGVRAVLVSTRPYHDAGASGVQELAYATATAAEYIRRLVEGGLSVNDAAKQIRFGFSVGGDFFPEIAKLRAARTLFAKVVAAFGGDAEAQAMSAHARTSAFTKTKRDPWVNMLRGTAETAAAAIAGVESIATSTFDERIGPSDDFSRRVARNTQVVLRDESYLNRVVDPAGGSYFLDALTDELAREAWTLFQQIEEKGGMKKALGRGVVHGGIAESAAARRALIAKRRTSIVGVNEFPNLGEAPVERTPADMAEVEGELGNSFGLSTPDDIQGLLMGVARGVQAHSDPGELVPAVMAATRAGVDMVSLRGMLRDGFPSVHVEPLMAWHQADDWEALRDASDMRHRARGDRPKAFFVQLGPIPAHKARSMWTANLLAAGGIEAIEGDGFDDVRDAVEAFDGSPLVVFIGKDESYDDAVETTDAFRKAGAKVIALAGKVPDKQETYRAQGVDVFLHAGADALETLTRLHAELEVTV